jgi:hypothetical protein
MESNQKSFVKNLLAVFLVFLCASWKWISPASALQTQAITSFPFEPSEEGLYVSGKVYTEQESKAYLKVNLPAQGIIPIEITVKNHTPNAYTLSKASVAVESLTPKEIAWAQSKKRLPGSIGLKVASLFFWPLMIPSAIEGTQALHSHRSLTKNLGSKTLQEKGEVLLPYTTTTRVLYVKEEALTEKFSLDLQDANSQKKRSFPISVALEN